MKNKHIIVIGNGMVGYKFCEKWVARAEHNAWNITVFGEEPRPAYDRVHLSEYFTSHDAEMLTMAPKDWYAERGIALHLSDPVISIDIKNKKVCTYKGVVMAYDKLVMATGSSAFVPNIPGTSLDGVFVYRTIEDLDMIMSYARKVKKGAVLGGGLLGLEAAKALLDLQLETHVIEFAPRLMPRQLDAEASGMLQYKMEQLGIKVHLNKSTRCIAGTETMTHMEFVDDSTLDVGMLVISAGIRPRDELARAAGLKVGERGGISVNDHMQTSDADVYAIGECALHKGMIYGLVAPGYDMADVAVNHIIDESTDKSFLGFDMSTKLKLIGVDVASFGDCFGETPGAKPVVYRDENKGVFKKIYLTADGKKLLGGMLVGEAADYNLLLQMAKAGLVCPPNPEDLILPKKAGGEATPGMGVEALPDDAVICSCEAVTKVAICGAVTDQDCTEIAQIKKCTKAGTGCGGCVPMVNDLMKYTLKSQGKVVKNVLCEHFDYSRQELLDLIKLDKIKTFKELIAAHGKGHGCEVCKPAVASMLASTWNEMVLAKPHRTLQDTNDRFLANIQRGGTYSVVPRVPGGEITPEKLIVLGEVAKKYNLYCKITGGQRIDLFGAYVNDLPDIWEELINAGFESGHAYAKALRTVKSCVGSTWCRFGVQDSVGFAIEVEERYRGLRAPHKLKSAVSGCIRECAEANSKDFGIIATEKGWNLYVCGNGGAKPQHAQLLASDIDKETCLKYIDRFLMFYIKTADPLTRTSVWLSKMEGGIEHLKDVVVNDCLGIAESLEAEMAYMIETYKCEWKEVVNNPELRKRFKHFANSDEKDPEVAFVEVRGQKQPAAW